MTKTKRGAGYDRVEYSRSIDSYDGRVDRDKRPPRDALVHALRGRRNPPYREVYLDYVGADDRFALCGVQIKIVLPEWFDEGDRNACPDCLQTLRTEQAVVWRA